MVAGHEDLEASTGSGLAGVDGVGSDESTASIAYTGSTAAESA